MQKVYLTRRNLLTLLSKLDRAAKGEETQRTIIKQDMVHSKYPCSDVIEVTAVEDAEYYADRIPGPVYPTDEPDCQKAVPPYWDRTTEATSETCHRPLPCPVHDKTAKEQVPRTITEKELERLYGESKTCFDPGYNLFWQNFTKAINAYFSAAPGTAPSDGTEPGLRMAINLLQQHWNNTSKAFAVEAMLFLHKRLRDKNWRPATQPAETPVSQPEFGTQRFNKPVRTSDGVIEALEMAAHPKQSVATPEQAAEIKDYFDRHEDSELSMFADDYAAADARAAQPAAAEPPHETR